MKYYLIAGEASGDLHASNLMKAIRVEDGEAQFRFFGGDLMQAAGGELVKHYREMAYMGFIPVILHARTILRNLKMCQEDIRACQPDVVILIDYPGFNLKIAKYIKTQLQIPVYYYISPKIWAWKKYRIKSFRKYVDRMFCILPFEVDFFKSLDYQVDYVGNPSVDEVAAFRAKKAVTDLFFAENGLADKPILAILAGSRKAEIKENLPTMLAVVAQFSQFQPVIAGAPGLTPDDYKQVIAKHVRTSPHVVQQHAVGDQQADVSVGDRQANTLVDDQEAGTASFDVKIVYGQTYALLDHASVALVTSGTATLEAALFRVPQVVCYYIIGGRLSNLIFDHLFHVPYISLVNLIAGKEVVQELFAANFSFKTIHAELKRIVEDASYRQQMLEGYDRVISILGAPGASERAAKRIVASLLEKKRAVV